MELVTSYSSCREQYHHQFRKSGDTSEKNIIPLISLHKAIRLRGINKPRNPHQFRTSFVTHLLDPDSDIGMIQKRLWHHSVKIIIIYIDILNNLE